MAGHHRDFVMGRLWPARALDPGSVWCILDGARDDRVFPLVRDSGLNYVCLYSGQLPPVLRMAAPYLVELDQEDSMTGRLIDLAWGNSWGVFLKARDSSRLRHHLKGFLRVRNEAGKNMVFRYYDPRVLRVYLPTCRLAELKTVFGPIQQFIAEGESPDTLIEFGFAGAQLETHVHELASRAPPARPSARSGEAGDAISPGSSPQTPS